MAKGVELNDDQLEAFSGGRDLVFVNPPLDDAKVIDLASGRILHSCWYKKDAIKWAQDNMNSGEKLYELSVHWYNDWQKTQWWGGDAAKSWTKTYASKVNSTPYYTKP